MKKFYILIIWIFTCLGIYAQTVNDVIQRMKEIRQENGDSIARDYLINNASIFENEKVTYQVLWGLLTSNIWKNNPTESIKKEYKEFLDNIYSNELKLDSFAPNEESLSTLWIFMTDYYNILFADGDNKTSLEVLKCLHSWFAPYPEARKTMGYAQSLLDLCSILRLMQLYDELQPLLKENIDVSKSVFGDKSTQYALALYYSCIIPTMPVSEKVERIQQAITIYEVADGFNPAYLDDMKKALNIQKTSMTGVAYKTDIIKPSNGIYEVGDCMTLIVAGRGAEAIESLLYHKNIYSEHQPLDTIEYSKVITYIIAAYLGLNELPAAQKEIENFESKIGIDNMPPNFASIFYSNAGFVAMRLKDYPKALRYLHTSLKISEKQNIHDIEYCKILSNLGITYGDLGKNNDLKQYLLDAKWYIDEAISAFEDNIGPIENGATGILLLNNKAYIYDAIGDTKVAMETYERIVADYADNSEVKESWEYAANNLSALYLFTGKYDQCIDILQKIDSKNRELNDCIAQNLILAYYFSRKSGFRKALERYNDVCRNNCLSAFGYFSESELENYWTFNARTLMFNNTAAERFPEVADVAYDNALFTKVLTLMSSEIVKDYVISENKSELIKLYKRVKDLRQNIKYNNNEDSVALWRNELQVKERNLIQLIPNFKERFFNSFSSWQDIKRCLEYDELAVEFVYWIEMDEKNITNITIHYGALVLTGDDNLPHFVNIGECSSIDMICNNRESDPLSISNYYNNTLGESIYESIWAKMESFLKGKRTVYFTPTGALNSVNHDAIITNDGQRLGEKYNLIRLSTTSKIASLKHGNNYLHGTVAIYGGINYDESVEDMRLMAKSYAKPQSSFELLALRAEDERGRWNLLSGTKQEMENIEALFKKHHLNPTIYTWNDANEESFKAMDSHSPSILHLSTHGFFMDTKEKINANPFMRTLGESSSKKDDMLLRTGLLLSGANNVWTGKEKISGIEDGILTADEISRLDLKNTKLVVLSACETAKGHIDEIDGVLGLQRAFKKAGASTIVMSLWKVPDHATSILMTSFYENLLEGKDARTALKEARKYLMNQNEAYKNPYYWAAFVVLD